MEQRFIKTEAADFVRDQDTMAIINTNVKQLKQLRARRDMEYNTGKSIFSLQEQVAKLTKLITKDK